MNIDKITAYFLAGSIITLGIALAVIGIKEFSLIKIVFAFVSLVLGGLLIIDKDQ